MASSSRRVALLAAAELRGADEDVRVSDTSVREVGQLERLAELATAIVEAGFEVVAGLDDVAVAVLALSESDAAPRVLPALPCVAVLDRHAEAAPSSLRSRADAFVQGPRSLPAAIDWVLSEERHTRAIGQPRLTVIGTSRGDFGNTRRLGAEPTLIGRSMAFEYHPQRPDRMPTPTGSIARHHARIRCVDGVVGVRDLRSTNGTLVLPQAGLARLLCPQEQEGSGRQFGPPASPWLVRDPSGDWATLAIGDHLQLPGFWRFRVDGDAAWRPED